MPPSLDDSSSSPSPEGNLDHDHRGGGAVLDGGGDAGEHKAVDGRQRFGSPIIGLKLQVATSLQASVSA